MPSFQVAVCGPLSDFFTYAYPEDLPLGTLVKVPFGKRILWGVVWGHGQGTYKGSPRTIEAIHPCIVFSERMRSFLITMALYMLCPLGTLLKMALPTLFYDHFTPYCDTENKSVRPLSFWQRKIGASRKKIPSGIFPCDFSLSSPAISLYNPFVLSNLQEAVLNRLKEGLEEGKPWVLQGVPGSGKTEVLLSLCQEVWKKGKQVLVILPEILLASQWEKRFFSYFHGTVSLWHSSLSSSQRHEMYEGIIYGYSGLIIGARSALYLPYGNIGLIIVDEEHEASYKQTEGVLYHGRDMAVLRASKEKIPIILVSATPSLETFFHCSAKNYQTVSLAQRYGHASLPSMTIIDMKPYKRSQWISPPLREALQKTLSRGEQSLLFLNRRGYACLFICYSCGYRSLCPQCSLWLSVHTRGCSHLLCHYCGFSKPLEENCPSCGKKEHLALRGPGIERVAEEVSSFLPQARIALVSSDHLSSASAMEETLTSIVHHEVDVIIGTQLVAKGHHFPFLTSIGIIDGDYGLSDFDFRSTERLFQLLYQVIGRAGREDLPGYAYIQTFFPQEPLWKILGSYQWENFLSQELEKRQQAHLPPFTRLISLTLSGPSEFTVQEVALSLQQKVPSYEGVEVWGPAPALLNPLQGRYRWRFLIKLSRSILLRHDFFQWLRDALLIKKVKVTLDRDPYDFM